MKTPNIYVTYDEDDVKSKLATYIEMSKKFMLKNREYKAVYKIFELDDSAYSLVFKLVKKDRNTMEETRNFYQSALDIYYGILADKLTPKW